MRSTSRLSSLLRESPPETAGEVPSKQLNLLETEPSWPLVEADAKLYRSAVGSAI